MKCFSRWQCCLNELDVLFFQLESRMKETVFGQRLRKTGPLCSGWRLNKQMERVVTSLTLLNVSSVWNQIKSQHISGEFLSKWNSKWTVPMERVYLHRTGLEREKRLPLGERVRSEMLVKADEQRCRMANPREWHQSRWSNRHSRLGNRLGDAIFNRRKFTFLSSTWTFE